MLIRLLTAKCLPEIYFFVSHNMSQLEFVFMLIDCRFEWTARQVEGFCTEKHTDINNHYGGISLEVNKSLCNAYLLHFFCAQSQLTVYHCMCFN